ncbi:response regulator [Candidatus Daviesbacteria bacterium]|nr:response regulator [Candidatus Daviesbacteria bacterium]
MLESFKDRARKKILVVEDENPIQRLLVDILEEAAYHVQTARFGREAIEKAKPYNPHLILLDLKLPDIDGNEVLQILGRDEKLKDIPVVVLSQYTHLLKQTPQVKAVIGKPFDIVDLLDTIESGLTSGRW